MAIISQNLDSSLAVSGSDLCVFVDPLDGTGEFVSGRVHCVSVLIGIALKGAAFAGLIFRPFVSADHPGEFIYGVVGQGSFLDHVRILSSPPIKGKQKSVVTSLKRQHRVMDVLFGEKLTCTLIREGGAGWKSWLVITGVADCYAYPRGGTKLWDVLAGDAILAGIGGITTDACGRPIEYLSTKLANAWGIMLSRDQKWHRQVLVPASHASLIVAASDPSNTYWPRGVEIPPRSAL